MRNQQQVKNSNRHNETKAKILLLMVKAKRYLTSSQIADKCDLSNNNASRQLTKLEGQGYLWRRNVDGILKYHYLKPMGIRVCKELWVRMKMIEQTGDSRIVLNLKKRIPSEYQSLHKKLSNDYYRWLWER